MSSRCTSLLLIVYLFADVAVLARTQTIVKTSVANMSNGDREIADYEDVVSATKNDSVYIIDVREPSEVKEGSIPNSINIPCK